MDGVTIGAGVILFVAANWGEIPRLVRVLVLVAGVVGFHALGWWLREVRASYPVLGHALLLVRSILFGGSVFLVAQMYHVDTHDPLGWLLWALGAAAVGLFVRSAPLATPATLAFGGWIVHELVTIGPEYESYKYLPGVLALYGLVALSYEISWRPTADSVEPGDTVYVSLDGPSSTWAGHWAARHRPAHGRFIRSTVQSAGQYGQRVRIRYGIESFYVEEGKAIEYERAIGSHDLYADVSITRDGNARLARLVVQR